MGEHPWIGQYPWLNFQIDLSKLSYKSWIKLGECVAKCVQISKVPLAPSIAKEMHKVYLAKGVSATTAIEGNTLTEEEVRLRIDNKLNLPVSKKYLGQEIDNIVRLCNEISQQLLEKKCVALTVDTIKRYNNVILQDVPLADYVVPGELRTYEVGVGTYKAPAHHHVPALMKQLSEWLESSYFEIDQESSIKNGIIKSIVAHLYLAWIHPFGDGNGRVGRILEFAILLSSGVPSPASHLLSNHYNATRSEYYRHLDLASKQNNVNEFIEYAIQGFLDGLNDQLKYIFKHIMGIAWDNYLYEKFREFKHTESYTEGTTKRRRTLVLELSKKKKPVPKNELVTMSQKTIDAYRTFAPKTLERDLAELEELGLIVKEESGYRAKIEIMRSFLPFRHT